MIGIIEEQQRKIYDFCVRSHDSNDRDDSNNCDDSYDVDNPDNMYIVADSNVKHLSHLETQRYWELAEICVNYAIKYNVNVDKKRQCWKGRNCTNMKVSHLVYFYH